MNGVDLSFAGDGTFFKLRGFNQILGLHQLEAANGGALPHPGWGLYDRDLFRLATAKYAALAATGKSFDLDLLTIDNHPPHGRPSPGCPKYAANANDVLQAVHCTDYLVGGFLDAISRNPAFKHTVVVVMSDHQSMRNDAWPLYPKTYRRRPLLFIINAGHGRRNMRFYHMDIAPTVLHLMGVKTNATFLAGADRSAANAPGSQLVNDTADVAVLRKALWSRARPLKLCERGILMGRVDNGVTLGGFAVPLLWRGRREVGLWSHGAWLVDVGTHSVHATVLTDFASEMLRAARVRGSPTSASTTELDYQSAGTLLRDARFGNESVLLVRPESDGGVARQFAVDWINPMGGITRVAEVPSLNGLEISAPHCADELQRMRGVPAGQTLDLRHAFHPSTADLYPSLPQKQVVWFNTPHLNALPLQRGVGWLRPEVWGSFTVSDYATLGFKLPPGHCHAEDFSFKVHPFLVPSRRRLDVDVYANGARMATWRFDHTDSAHTWHTVETSIRTPDPKCRVDLRFVFRRPGAAAPPYPQGEDPRPLQLLFLEMQPAAEVVAP